MLGNSFCLKLDDSCRGKVGDETSACLDWGGIYYKQIVHGGITVYMPALF